MWQVYYTTNGIKKQQLAPDKHTFCVNLPKEMVKLQQIDDTIILCNKPNVRKGICATA